MSGARTVGCTWNAHPLTSASSLPTTIRIFRKGFREILAVARELVIVGEAADGDRALDLIRATRPHVAVLDVDMQRKNGLAVAGQVRAMALEAAIIIMTMHKKRGTQSSRSDTRSRS
jgi:DNA-binding NarL/FixJ family response regulator